MSWKDWKSSDLLEKTAQILETDPEAGRTEISRILEITEYKARELIRDVKGMNGNGKLIGPTIATFDLETTNLIADVGRLLCGSILSYPSMEMVTFRIEDYCEGKFSRDGDLALAIRNYIEQHTMSCGWFSKGFDIAFLNTRLVQNGHRAMNRMLHIDPIWYFRGWRGLKPRSSKMAVVAEFYDIERKQDVDVSVWADAMAGDTEAMDILVDRCESDVRITSELMMKAFEAGLIKTIQCYP